MPANTAVESRPWEEESLVGGGGALIVVLEGLQQLQQNQQNLTIYRSSSEPLKHEKFFLVGARPFAAVINPESLLAERVAGLVSQEHEAWVSHHEEGGERIGGGG